MVSNLIVAGLLALVPGVAWGQGVSIYGPPGPYEVHQYHHRTNSFDRAPHFATNPPVYYGEQRLVRSYGWTPYPYVGTQYEEPLIAAPEAVNGKSVPAKPMRDKDRRRAAR